MSSLENYASLNQITKQQGQYMDLQDLKTKETNYEIPDSEVNPLRAEYEIMPEDQ